MDIKAVKNNLLKRKAAKTNARLELCKAAARDFDAIVQMIINRYRPEKIVQWGSLLCPEQFDEHSDIDIAIQGITDPECFFALLGDAMYLTRFPLDIVQLEKIEPEFAELILMKGKTIYES